MKKREQNLSSFELFKYVFIIALILSNFSCKEKEKMPLENEVLSKTINDENGNSVFYEYYEKDKIKSKITFDPKERVLSTVNYNHGGDITRKSIWVSDSTNIVQNFDNLGFKKDSCLTDKRGNCIDKIFRFYNASPNIAEIVELEGRRRNGNYTKLYQDSTIEIKGNYTKGLKNGVFEYYTETGKLIRKEIWESDELKNQESFY